MSNPCPYLSCLEDQGSRPVRDPVQVKQSPAWRLFTAWRPLSRVHAPCWAVLMGAGTGPGVGIMFLPSIFNPRPQGLLRKFQEASDRACLWEDFSKQLELLPNMDGG